MYTFLLDRRSMSLLLLGTAVTVLLFFSSGFLLGMWAGLPQTVETEAEFSALADDWQPSSLDDLPAIAVSPPPDPAPPIVTPPPPPPVAPPPPPPVVTAPVVTAPVPPPPPPPPPPKKTIVVYSVQVGWFEIDARANLFAEDLRERGWEPYIMRTTLPSGKPAISVRIGRYSRLEEALKAAAAFESAESIDTFVRWTDLEAPVSTSGSQVPI